MNVDRDRSRSHALIAAAIAVLLGAAPVRGQPTQPETAVSIRALLEYQYGDEDQGRLDLDPRLGMIAPDVEVWFLGGKAGLELRYSSGDFDGGARQDLPAASEGAMSEDFGSHKEMQLDESREDIHLLALYRPESWIVLSAGYKYLNCELDAQLDLVSDLRAYGKGSESYDSTVRGAMFGMAVRIPWRERWTLVLDGKAMPFLSTEVRSGYLYDLTFEDRTMSEQWVHNGNATGWAGRASISFALPKENISLQVGYVYQRITSDDDVETTWVDRSLGQGARDWRENRYHGVTFGTAFHF